MAPAITEQSADGGKSPGAPDMPNGTDKGANSKTVQREEKMGQHTRKNSQGNSKSLDQSQTAKSSGKELKAKKQAEKAARRAKDKEGRQEQPRAELKVGNAAPGEKSKPPSSTKTEPAPGGKAHHRRKSSAGGQAHKALALRQAESSTSAKPEEPKREDKRVTFFEHLYGHGHRSTIAGASKEVHPSILALGLKLSNYEICGSNARCLATLLILKEVITIYETPPGNSLPRHLTTHLAHQVDYLVSCRPLSVSQGNAIRWLKVKISSIDVGMPEEQAKQDICAAIDHFIRDRIIVADEVIATSASEKIKDGDVILTFGKSSIVQKTLFEAHKRGTNFKVIVSDGPPLFEGKHLALALEARDIEVQYSPFTELSHVVTSVTKCILGAHAMLANGRLYSRVGTAMVAMLAKDANLPVMICCESVKLTERAALDSFTQNEIAPEEELLPIPKEGQPANPLEKWREVPNLRMLNVLYDLTPPEFIDVVVTEHGNMPPQSVIAVQRLATNA